MIILHIGFPKTATTALQRVFFENASILLKQELHYPLVDKDFKQRGLRALLTRKSAPDRRVSALERQQLDALAASIRGSAAQVILMSCEELTNELDFDLSAPRLAPLVEFVTGLGHEVTLVAYARNPVDYYLSRMQERLKYQGGIVTPGAYQSRFTWTLDQHEKAFSTQVRVRPFERAQLVSGNITEDFFHTVRDLVNIETTVLADLAVNESLSAEVMFCLDLMHSATGVQGKRSVFETGTVCAL